MNALCVADAMNLSRIVFPRARPMILPEYHRGVALLTPSDETAEGQEKTYSGRFFKPSDLPKELLQKRIDFSIFNKRRLAFKHNLVRIFTFSQLPPRRVVDTVFYMRGGDIFRPKPHRGYLQYPIYFVEKVLDLRGHTLNDIQNAADNEKQVLAQVQDLTNPVAKWWSDCRLPHNDPNASLDEALHAMMHCKALAYGVSTLPSVAVYLSKHLEHVYYPDYFACNVGRDLSSTVISLPGYIKRGTWKGDHDQLNQMVTYKPH